MYGEGFLPAQDNAEQVLYMSRWPQGDAGQVLCKLKWLLMLLTSHSAAWCCLPGVMSLLQLVTDVLHAAF